MSNHDTTLSEIEGTIRQYLATANERWNHHYNQGSDSPHLSAAQHEYGKVCAYRAALDIIEHARQEDTQR